MSQDFVVVIPARYASERLPGKPLRHIAGKPMLQHVYERGIESGADKVIIATDDARIQDAARLFAAHCCMTSQDHQSGTDRLAEVARQMEWDDECIIVNLQGDEPLMPSRLIRDCAAILADLVSADEGFLSEAGALLWQADALSVGQLGHISQGSSNRLVDGRLHVF
jgi:3-deoxy-manno-octulosonate cytidylyltransferase (CMP-KDO synthetase)